jgi:hypothetical protein
MAWVLSRFRAGDLVEVRSKEEILGTLDEHGCNDSMPFMPEMLQYCGGRFRVGAVAHKTCDMVGEPGTGRRLQATVHLTGLRCDGGAHDGCQAECNLFWKDVWLKPAGEGERVPAASSRGDRGSHPVCTERDLVALTKAPVRPGFDQPRYSCQATEMYKATRPLAWWDVRQYFYDVRTRNHSPARVLRVMCLSATRRLLERTPIGYRIIKRFSDWLHLRLSGRPAPSSNPKVPEGTETPTGRQGFQAGEFVRIRAQGEIERTLNQRSRNRGLTFDPEEMAPYCGRVVKVRKAVTKIIEEPTGKMLNMKQPCVMLEGVVCRAEYARGRLNCPRAIPSYWREIWLDRVEDPNGSGKAVR